MKRIILLSAMVLPIAAFAQSWSINGNSGTNANNHFVGTTDNRPLNFRINNRSAGKIDSVNQLTYFGYGAGRTNAGFDNVAIGFKALFSNTGGGSNTALGNMAMYSNTTGVNNLAVGRNALYFNTSGNANNAIGLSALQQNTSGSSNSAVGFYTLSNNTTGTENTAVGNGALNGNTTGNYNTALGNGAISYGYNTASYNTALGNLALYYNTTGWANTATGSGALFSNTTGGYNVTNGGSSMRVNSSGSYNTASGYWAMYYNSTGSYNTGIGYASLLNTTVAQYNTAIGYAAGYSYDLGWNNTFLGANSGTNANGRYNVIAIGQGVIATANSQARIGNSATNSIGGYANWTNFSDGRFKKDVAQNVKGLEFILKLKAVTYHLDISGIDKKMHTDTLQKTDPNAKKAVAAKEKILYSGFIAQDVEKAASDAGYDFSGVDKPEDDNGFYGLRYAEFVVPLVKGMQEQQEMIVELKKQNELLQQRLSLLEKKMLGQNAATINDVQVRPNPSKDRIYITTSSDDATTGAIKIFDNKGSLVKQQQVKLVSGNNQFAVDVNGLPNGLYQVTVEWNNGLMKKTTQLMKQ